ncbi:MAG: hypothetical protein ACYC27_17885 [Armatimonadota bacterium]
MILKKPLKTIGVISATVVLIAIIIYILRAEMLSVLIVANLIVSLPTIWRYVTEAPPDKKEPKLRDFYLEENIFAQREIRKAMFISRISSDISFMLFWWLIVGAEGYRIIPQFIYSLIDRDAVYSLNTHPYLFSFLVYLLFKISRKLITINIINRLTYKNYRDKIARFLEIQWPSPSFVSPKLHYVLLISSILFLIMLTLGCRVRIGSEGIDYRGAAYSHKGWEEVESITRMKPRYSWFQSHKFWRVKFADESHLDIPHDGSTAAEYIALRSKEYIDYRAKTGITVKSAPVSPSPASGGGGRRPQGR